MKRLLLVAQGNPPFVERDAQLLARHFQVERFTWRGLRDVRGLRRAVGSCDAVLAWFAEVHAAVAVHAARGRGIRAVTVVGGYDVQSIPEIGYGVPNRSWPVRRLVRYALERSHRVLVVDPSLTRAARENLGADVSRFEYLPTAYDATHWTPGDAAPQRRVLTVGTVDATTIHRKGIALFCEVARRLPDVPFVVAGTLRDEAARRLQRQAPPNVSFLGRVSDDELLEEYRRSHVYAQFSVAEGLPNALCEAMLCGCVPVGTDAGGIADAIGDAGILCRDRDPAALAAAVERALSSRTGRAARERIAGAFTPQRREAGLLRALAGSGKTD